MQLNIVIPITASIQRRDESFTRPLALEQVKGKPLIAWVIEGLREVLAGAGGVLFAALAEHEDRFDLTRHVDDQIRPLLGRQPGVIVLDREPRGELEAVLRLRGALEGSQQLLVARGDRMVRSELHQHIRILGTSPHNKDIKGVVSVIGLGRDPRPVVRTGPDESVRQVEGREAGAPLLPTGVCYFTKAAEFLEVADALVRQGKSPEAEPAECFQEYIARGWRVQVSHAQEVWRLAPTRRDRLAHSHDL